MARVFLSLGTNVGNREENIKTALEFLQEEFGRPYEALSEIVETKAVGFEGPDFLNGVVRFEVELPARKVLSVCKAIERRMGRTDLPQYDSDGRRVYHDRIIDIDILDMEGVRTASRTLSIPHPQLPNRPFFRELLLQVGWK